MAGLVVHTGTVSHPLLGRAHVIEHAGRPITAMSEISWDRPAQIPTIAEPRALPPGSGTLLMNEIAIRAQRAGVDTLRYAGPYPTHALFASLLRSFRTTGTAEQFTANVLERAVRVARDEVPIEFAPAPFVRTTTTSGYRDLRDGAIDRLSLANIVFDREEQTGSLAQLIDRRAVLTVGVPIAHIAELDDHHEVIDGPHPVPAFAAAVNGSPFAQELVEALAGAATVYAAAPLADDVSAKIRASRITWGDLGWRSTRRSDDGFVVHAGFMVLARRDMATFADRLSYHLAMSAQSAVLDELLASPRRSS